MVNDGEIATMGVERSKTKELDRSMVAHESSKVSGADTLKIDDGSATNKMGTAGGGVASGHNDYCTATVSLAPLVALSGDTTPCGVEVANKLHLNPPEDPLLSGGSHNATNLQRK